MDYVKEVNGKIEKNILLPKIINKSIDVVDEIAYDLNSDSEDDDNLNSGINILILKMVKIKN